MKRPFPINFYKCRFCGMRGGLFTMRSHRCSHGIDDMPVSNFLVLDGLGNPSIQDDDSTLSGSGGEFGGGGASGSWSDDSSSSSSGSYDSGSSDSGSSGSGD